MKKFLLVIALMLVTGITVTYAQFQAEILQVEDDGNTGYSPDISITFNGATDESNIEKYLIYIVKEDIADQFNVAKAIELYEADPEEHMFVTQVFVNKLNKSQITKDLNFQWYYDGDINHHYFDVGRKGPFKLFILSYKTDSNHVLSEASTSFNLEYIKYINVASGLTIPQSAYESNLHHKIAKIFVEPGTYYLTENISFFEGSLLEVEMSISLISTAGATQTTIVGLPNQNDAVINVSSCNLTGIHDVTIDGFTIINGNVILDELKGSAIDINAGAGYEIMGIEECKLQNLIIKDCIGTGPPISILSKTSTLNNILMYDNIGSSCSGILQRNSVSCIYNNVTIANNSTINTPSSNTRCIYFQAIDNDGFSVSVNNSILRSYEQVEIFGAGNVELTLNNSNTTNNYSGLTPNFINCINDDPQFIDTDNYHLQSGSPCINSGNNSLVPQDLLYDIDGFARIIEGIVNMGVYETTSGLVLEPFDDVCINAAPLVLSGGYPIGGSYSGTGVFNDVFFPNIAGIGTHIITYSVEDASVSQPITVSSLPTANISGDATICEGQTTPLTFTFTGNAPWIFSYTDGATTFQDIQANFSTHIIDVSSEGTYQVVALSDANCTGNELGGQAMISVSPSPNSGATVIGSTVCEGEEGEVIIYPEIDVLYQAYIDGIFVGEAFSGIAETIIIKITSEYFQVGENIVEITATKNNCTITLDNSATIIVNPLHVKDLEIFGDSICQGENGVVMIWNPEINTLYQAFIGHELVGEEYSAGGKSLDISISEKYLKVGLNYVTIKATNICGSVTMDISPVIKVNSLPDNSLTITGSTIPGLTDGYVTITNPEVNIRYDAYIKDAHVGNVKTDREFRSIKLFIPHEYLKIGKNVVNLAASSEYCITNMIDTPIVNVIKIIPIDDHSNNMKSSDIDIDLAENLISIYPNPTNNIVNVSANIQIERIEIKDAGGRTVKITDNINSKFLEINLNDLTNGIYIINMKLVDSSIITERLIKK